MHPLVQMVKLTRQEFLRGLRGLSDEDARKRIEPMNCISWIIGHVANQQHACFVAWPRGEDVASRYRPFGFGSPASQPPLDEVMALWRDSCDAADRWLDVSDEEAMQERFVPRELMEDENAGTLVVRHLFHTWSHIGEISAIR